MPGRGPTAVSWRRTPSTGPVSGHWASTSPTEGSTRWYQKMRTLITSRICYKGAMKMEIEMSDSSDKELTFEELMRDLEDCASTIEEGGLPLDEASKMYQRGMDLALEASQRLAAQELSIKNISDAYQEAMDEIQNLTGEKSGSELE